MVDYLRSDTPTLSFTTFAAAEALQIVVTNPTPTGGRPAVLSNSIWRRATGSTGNWTLVGTTGVNGVFNDLFERASTSFDYFVRTDTFAESVAYTVTTPAVTGLWAYAAADPTTIQHFPYTDGGAESIDEQEAALQFVGRQYAVIEAGIQETQTVGLNVIIPFSDTDWRTQVEWWRLRKREKRTLLYRDGRGRMFAARIMGPLSITPTKQGATVTGTLQRVDYVASTTEQDPSYFTGGANNNGGNGIYGNGLQGNGY